MKFRTKSQTLYTTPQTTQYNLFTCSIVVRHMKYSQHDGDFWHVVLEASKTHAVHINIVVHGFVLTFKIFRVLELLTICQVTTCLICIWLHSSSLRRSRFAEDHLATNPGSAKPSSAKSAPPSSAKKKPASDKKKTKSDKKPSSKSKAKPKSKSKKSEEQGVEWAVIHHQWV